VGGCSCPASPVSGKEDHSGQEAGGRARTNLRVMTTCPDPEEVAEAFVLKKLTPDQDAAFRVHIMECLSCAQLVTKTRVFVQSLRDAVQENECLSNFVKGSRTSRLG
jgi:hypothetical protein